MAIKIAKKTEGTATITKALVDGKNKQNIAEGTAEEKVAMPAGKLTVIENPWCEVGVDVSYTKNLGNYQSAKVGVTIKVPCQHPDLDETYEYARDWANARMAQMVEDLGGA